MYCTQLFILVLMTQDLAFTSSISIQQAEISTTASSPPDLDTFWEKVVKGIDAPAVNIENDHICLDSIKQFQEESTKNADKVWQEMEKNLTLLINAKFQSQSEDILTRLNRIESAMSSSDKASKSSKEPKFTLFTDSKLNWYEAFADCRKRGLTLASIESQAEYDDILKQIKALEGTKSGSFWVSASDLIQDNKFVWMSTGRNVGYSKWCPSEPNKYPHHGTNEREHCVELRPRCDYGMNDQICSSQNYYICEDRNGDISTQTCTDVSQKRSKAFTVFSSDKLNWFDALVDCKRKGLRLATIESAKEQEEVVNLIKSQVTGVNGGTSFWLSGSDLGHNGDYVWMTSGKPIKEYTGWFRGPTVEVQEPNHLIYNGEMEHCLNMKNSYDYKWNDDQCLAAKNFYICDNQN